MDVYRRRRLVALSVLVGLVLGIVIVTSGSESKPKAEAAKPAGPPQMPRGGRTLFPRFRVVAYYGAPQDAQLGELGIGTPAHAAAKLERQARPYARAGLPLVA